MLFSRIVLEIESTPLPWWVSLIVAAVSLLAVGVAVIIIWLIVRRK